MLSVGRVKWSQWLAIALIAGAVSSLVLTSGIDDSGDSHSISQREFEDLLFRAPLSDGGGRIHPWIQHIVVHPPVMTGSGQYYTGTQSISFDAYREQSEAQNTFRLISYNLIVKVPFEPVPVHDAGRGEGMPYPGLSLYKAQSGDTLDTIMAHVYGGPSPRRRMGIIEANNLLRRATNSADLEIQPDRAYYVPLDPETNPTIVQFLNEAAKSIDATRPDGAPPFAFRYAWWEAPRYAWTLSMATSLSVLGFLIPGMMYLLSGPQREVEVDHQYASGGGDSKEEPPSSAMTAEDDEKLQEVISSLTAATSGYATSTVGEVESHPAAPRGVKTLAAGLESEPVASPPAESEPHSFRGEFYPVILPGEARKAREPKADKGGA